MRRLKHVSDTSRDRFIALVKGKGYPGISTVAAAVDLHPCTLSRALGGGSISRKTAKRLATLLGVSIEELGFNISTAYGRTKANAVAAAPDELQTRLAGLVGGGE